MTESEIEEFERLKRRIRGDWIATIQMELIKLDYCAMLVTIDNHEAFLGHKSKRFILSLLAVSFKRA
nr:hypothetical protein [Nostoc sp. ChiQUE02]MDZ8234816.1 hypothetical protein [Nostoc sp. ChiQUE02]